MLHTFEKFKQGAAKEYRFDLYDGPDMNHVEAAILDMVARLYPGIFSALEQYCRRHRNFLDPTIGRFDREVQFYLACIEHIERFQPTGLPFCYPTVTDRSKEVYGREVFDLALANNLTQRKHPGSDQRLLPEGPGTHLCRVRGEPGRENHLRPHFWTTPLAGRHRLSRAGQGSEALSLDKLFTHFEREEDLRNLSGKLEDDLLRIHGILERATPNSILIMNECFSSTTVSDSLFLSKQLIERIMQRDMLCVSVTFLDELASLSESTVSMVSTVDPQTPGCGHSRLSESPPMGLPTPWRSQRSTVLPTRA